MGQVRCEICRSKLPTTKSLFSHYLNSHTKFKLARELFKLSISTKIPKILSKTKQNKTEKRSESRNSDNKKAETLFFNENIQILYRDNEIIIRDDRSSVDMEISFDENSSESKENHLATQKDKAIEVKSVNEINNNLAVANNSEFKEKLQYKTRYSTAKNGVNISSSSASSEDSLREFSFKKRIRKKKESKENKSRHYKINITRSNDCKTLDEHTGSFYQCHCREDNKFLDSTDLKLASDTESASDTGKNNSFNDPKVFCSKCGNGYRDESLLMEHMKIHETHCRVCNEIFPTEQSFKKHIQTHMFKVFVCHICNYEFPVKPMLHKHFECHMEDSILESVLDMEEDYNTAPLILISSSYKHSIGNILCYLGENQDMYYNSQPTKVYCDICLCELFYSDYESHMQGTHCIYAC